MCPQFFIPSGGGERSALEPAPQALLMGASVRTTTLRTGVDLSSLVTTAGGGVCGLLKAVGGHSCLERRVREELMSSVTVL